MATKKKPDPPFHLRLAIPFDLDRDADRAFVEAMEELPNGTKTAVVRQLLLGVFVAINARPNGMQQLVHDAMMEQKQRGRERGRPALNPLKAKAVKLRNAGAVGNDARPIPSVKVVVHEGLVPVAADVAATIQASSELLAAPAMSVVQLKEPIAESAGRHSMADFNDLLS